MSGVNTVHLLGNCGKDPETRYTPSGAAVTNVSLATSESWTDKQNGKQERTTWHNLVFFNKLAEIVGEYVKKGSKIYVEGSIRTNKWQTKTGEDRYTTEIVCKDMQMLDSKGSQPAQTVEPTQSQSTPKPEQPAGFDDFDDDIPF